MRHAVLSAFAGAYFAGKGTFDDKDCFVAALFGAGGLGGLNCLRGCGTAAANCGDNFFGAVTF